MKPFNLGLVMVMSAAISIVTPGTVQARQSTQATSVLSSLSPPPLTPGQMQAEIQPFCAHIDLDIALLLRAVLAKDEALSPLQLQERLNKGWQASFDAHWQENAFDTVFHSYFYRYALSRHHVLSPAQQAQLKHLRQDFEQTLAGMRVPAITPTYHPMFEPTSAITPDYTFSFKAQPQVPGYTWLYRSSASNVSALEHELWAIETLLEKPASQLAATGVWRRYHQKQKDHPTQASDLHFKQAAQEVEQELLFLQQQHLLKTELLQTINWDTGFRPDNVFFLSGDYATTALYGSTIFLIKQQHPRGIALNEQGESEGFYQNLPYAWLLSTKGFWIFAMADKKEYLLPAYLSHSEIKGADIRGPRQLYSPHSRTGMPGALLRKYRKHYNRQTGQQCVMVLDAQGHWMGTLSLGVLRQSPGLKLSASAERLDENLLARLPEGIIYTPTESLEALSEQGLQ